MEVRRLKTNFPDELYHHGIKGQRWGIRRYQNPDGTLTEAGKRHYVRSDGSFNQKKYTRDRDKLSRRQANADRKYSSKNVKNLSDTELQKRIQRYQNEVKLKELTDRDLHPVSSEAKSLTKRVLTHSAGTLLTSAVVGAASTGIYLKMTGKKLSDTMPYSDNTYMELLARRMAGMGKNK